MVKVLIAEDSVLLADMLEAVLTSAGYEVVGIARTVRQAVALADLHEPHLAVLDFRLAEGGFGSQIRPLLQDKMSMGILYISGDELNKTLTSADGEGYIQKPYALDDLIQALRSIREVQLGGDRGSAPRSRGFRRFRDPPPIDRPAA